MVVEQAANRICKIATEGRMTHEEESQRPSDALLCYIYEKSSFIKKCFTIQ